MKSKLNLVILGVIFLPFISISEELSDVLKDAYKFYPDIEKSKTELKISENDLKISKTDFLPSIDFSASQGRKISKSNPDTSRINDSAFNPTTFDIDLSQPLGYTKNINLKQAKNNLNIAKLSFYSSKIILICRAKKIKKHHQVHAKKISKIKLLKFVSTQTTNCWQCITKIILDKKNYYLMA